MTQMTQGIYTVANDVVYDQLVALLNSIEINVGTEIPVCVIAYDDRLDKVRSAVESRPNVTLLNEPELFERWEEFSRQVWATHPTALKIWEEQGIKGVNRIGMNRRYCAFDSQSLFDKFIYFDADVLVLNSLDIIFEALDEHDFVVYDFQYKDPSHIFNLSSEKLLQIFDKSQIDADIFCAGFYASKRGIFNLEQREWLLSKLGGGEAEVLYMKAPNQSVLNYMRMRSGIPIYNLARQLPKGQATGNSVTSPHFEMRNNVLYDKGQRLTYLHYIGISSKVFEKVCAGENIEFPYRDVFLHYRYLHEPENRPEFTTKPKPYKTSPNFAQRMMKKLRLNR